MLIGACDPMLCPIWGFRYSVGAQMSSWFFQLQATGQLDGLATVVGGVFFAGGTYGWVVSLSPLPLLLLRLPIRTKMMFSAGYCCGACRQC